MEMLEIGLFAVDNSAQPRAQMDMIIVAEYGLAMQSGDIFPPVVTFHDGDNYWLADGFHRWYAASAYGIGELPVDVRKGGLREAILHSVGANVDHGLRRSNEDKRRAVEIMLADDEWSQWSDREIARRCGVSQPYVGNLRQVHTDNVISMNTTRKFTHHKTGKPATMNTANIGKPSQAIEDAAQQFTLDGRDRSALQKQSEEDIKKAVEELKSGEAKDVRGAISNVKRKERVEYIDGISKEPTPLTGDLGRFPVLYADPPWRYEHVKTGNRAIENQYPTMSLEEICDLPVSEIATPDAVLFMWATNPKLQEAFSVIDSWGFTYRTNLVWVKDKIGMGYWARQRHELILVATRGMIPVPEPKLRFDSVLDAPRGKHSEKPISMAERIDIMFPDYKKIELFSRKKRDGWQSWGFEA